MWIGLTISDLAGMPIAGLGQHTDTLLAAAGTDRVLAQLATLWVALLIALFADRIDRTGSAFVVLIVSTAALLPSALGGHAGHHPNPVLAMFALGVHLAAMAIWVGGLLGLIVHLRGFRPELRSALPRFSSAALICVLAVGLSGVVESIITLEDWSALLATDRGHLITAKTVALSVLAVVGYVHRKRTLGPAGAGRLLPLLRLAAVELLIMCGTVGAAVALSSIA